MTVLVIGHRGAPREAPGNTLAAFEAAIQLGADMVECDVRRTRDGVLVVHHNPTRRRAPVSRLTYAALVRRCRHRPPTLDAVTSLCAGRIGVNVEIKQRGCEPQVIDVMSRRFSRRRLLITSFDEEVITAAKRTDPSVLCGLLVGPGRVSARRSRRALFPLHRAEQCGADCLVLHQLVAPVRRRRFGPPGLLEEAERRGRPVVVWTVNGQGRLTRYLGAPAVAGIITDLPGLAVRLRAAQSPADPKHLPLFT